jgi:hypothetical protein
METERELDGLTAGLDGLTAGLAALRADLAVTSGRRLAAARRSRRTVERDSARARARLEALIEGFGDPLIVVDRSGRAEHANGRARGVLGPLLGRLPPIEELGERGRRVIELSDPAAGQRRFDLRTAPVLDASAVVAVVLVAREVTGRHDVIETRARLDGAIKTARLVAHELNNRLTSLTGLGGMLAESDDAAIADVAQRVVDSATEVGELVSRLQELKRFAETTSEAGSPMLDLDSATMPRQPG